MSYNRVYQWNPAIPEWNIPSGVLTIACPIHKATPNGVMMVDLEKYRLGEELGRGGVAVVYKGYHKVLNKAVAIKVLHDQFTKDDEFIQRFVNGARSAALLKHRNIIDVSDVGQEEGVYYIVMEYLEGETLEERIKKHGPFSEKDIRKILEPLAEALDYAHGKGVIHRDIKSANIFLAANGRVVLMDFDIAKASEITVNLTIDGTMLGTPAYMSPEQAMGEKSSSKSDIYSLGVVIYEMATGELPFKGESPLSILRQITMDPPPPVRDINPNLSEKLQKSILWCLEKKPEDRPAFAREIFGASDLETLASKPDTGKEKADKKASTKQPQREKESRKERKNRIKAEKKKAKDTEPEQPPEAKDGPGALDIQEVPEKRNESPEDRVKEKIRRIEKKQSAGGRASAGRKDSSGRPGRKPTAFFKTVMVLVLLGLIAVGPGMIWPEWNYGMGLISFFIPGGHHTGRLPDPEAKPADLSDVQKERVRNLYDEALTSIKGEEIDKALGKLQTISDMDPGNRLAHKGRQKVYDFYRDKAGEMFDKADLVWYCRYMDRAVDYFPVMRLDNLYERGAKFSGSMMLVGTGDKNAAAVYGRIISQYSEEEYAVERLYEVLELAMSTGFAQARSREVCELVIGVTSDLPSLSSGIYLLTGDAYYTNNVLLSGDKYNAAWMYSRSLDSDPGNDHAKSQLQFILAELRNRARGPGSAAEKRDLIRSARRNFPSGVEFTTVLDSLQAEIR